MDGFETDLGRAVGALGARITAERAAHQALGLDTWRELRGAQHVASQVAGHDGIRDALGFGAIHDAPGVGAIRDALGLGAIRDASGFGAIRDAFGLGAIRDTLGLGAIRDALGLGAFDTRLTTLSVRCARQRRCRRLFVQSSSVLLRERDMSSRSWTPSVLVKFKSDFLSSWGVK